MDKYIINEQPLASGVYEIHNASQSCAALPSYDEQRLIGYFANPKLAYQRARMSWPTAKVECCEKCCHAAAA